MPVNKFNGFSNFGIGIGLRSEHYEDLLIKKPAIHWLEIISENYMLEGGKSLSLLEQVLDTYKVIQHGVSLYVGSSDPLDWQYLNRLKKLIKQTGTPFISDHLCWGSVDGTLSHDLLPLPYTFEAVVHTAGRVRQIQEFLEIPICLENVSSYAEFNNSEMTEWQFLSEVVERADCGILLDVNNIYVASQNHSFDPLEYLHNIPMSRVGQIHVAGHTKFEKYILDTHEGPVINDVWQLYAQAIKLAGPTNTLLEWDTNIPSLDIVHSEALKAHQYSKDIEKTLSKYA